MFSPLKKTALAGALAATALTSVTPAMAQGYGGYRHRDRGDSTGAAIVGGIVGIAIGALIASSGNKNKHRGYRNDLEYRDGYYYDRQGRRCDREGRPYEDQGYYQRRGYGDGSDDRYGYGYGYGGRDNRGY